MISLAVAISGLLAGQDSPPLLVLLSETGETRGELPVLEVNHGSPEVRAALERGLSGTLLRVYRHEQEYLSQRDGSRTEPVYVLLSEHQGGFARQGFVLGNRELPNAGYIDVHRKWPAAGSFGALDQIVPHELAHVMRRQLVGELNQGFVNQVHALGLRTDRQTAFNEGFAEHLQVMAIDDPDADPRTAALASASDRFEATSRNLASYARELRSRVAVVPRMRLGFVAWYSKTEDVARYSLVKANGFARRSALPLRLLRRDPYSAYLLESILPGTPGGAPRSLSRLLATEGVVSTFFVRWATEPALRAPVAEDSFYRRFGADRTQVSPLETVYLKLLHTFSEEKPQDLMELISGYLTLFPDERSAVERLFLGTFLTELRAPPPEIWLANPAFETGTTLYDQYRAAGRVHTFDLNGASLVDLVGVEGVDLALARAIQAAAPFDEVEDLARTPGVSAGLVAHFAGLEREMTALSNQEDESIVENLTIQTILRPYVRRLVVVTFVAIFAGALLYRWLLSRRDDPRTGGRFSVWFWAALASTAATFLGLPSGWLAAGWAGLGTLATVILFFGAPAALLFYRRTGNAVGARWTLLAWIGAGLPAALAVTPLL